MAELIARCLWVPLLAASMLTAAAETPRLTDSYACRALKCSTLIPTQAVDDPATNDCGYRNGNEWWVDYVAGSLAWDVSGTRAPITVALFDDGADVEHPDLRNRLWTNPREAVGKPGVDDDGNGYVDDIHGWDFVDDDANVAPQGECVGRASHGTLMASLVAAERNNGIGIAAAGSDGARVMVLRIAGCGGKAKDQVNPDRIRRALEYATRMGARILSFSAHWSQTTPELDAAFAHIADSESSPDAALVIASVPNKGEDLAGYPAAYPFRRIVRAIPIGDADIISPGTSAAPPGANLGAPSACVLGASAGAAGYRIEGGSSNSTAILAGLLAGLWSSPRYVRFTPDEFLTEVVRDRMLRTPRRSQPDLLGHFPTGVPIADACTLATKEKTARVCLEPGQPRGPSK